MISAQTRFRVYREGKPVSTFPDHALAGRDRVQSFAFLESLERFRAKWTPVRVKKTRQTKK
jgi:hypothetical protein